MEVPVRRVSKADIRKAKKMIEKRKREESEDEESVVDLAEEGPDEGEDESAKDGIEARIPAATKPKKSSGIPAPVRRSQRIKNRVDSGLMEVRRIVGELMGIGGGC